MAYKIVLRVISADNLPCKRSLIPLWFTKPKRAIGLDIGTHSVKAVLMSRSGGRLFVEEASCVVLDRAQVNTNPVMAHADAMRAAVQHMAPAQCLLVAALPGQTAVIRYPRIADVPRDKMAEAVQREAGQNIPYDLNEVFLDWSPLDEAREGEQRQTKVLLVAAKHEVINTRLQLLDAAEIKCGVLGVDSLALADAAEACGMLREGETVAMVNIGLTSSSIHFIKDGVSNFIRDVTWGAREMIQAIAKDRRCDFEEAERVLREADAGKAAMAPAAEAPPETLESLDPFETPPAQSGGSLLDPLDDELGLGAPLGEAPPKPVFADESGSRDIRELLSGTLSRLVGELRKSFDFYEHQLYEKAVDRVLLSGGLARLGLLSDTILDEIGVNSVECADPAAGNLMLGDDAAVAPLREHPAQFMVAIGLAARGMADL